MLSDDVCPTEFTLHSRDQTRQCPIDAPPTEMTPFKGVLISSAMQDARLRGVLSPYLERERKIAACGACKGRLTTQDTASLPPLSRTYGPRLDIRMPAPDRVDHRNDQKRQQHGRRNSSHHWGREPLHDISPCSSRPHHRQKSQNIRKPCCVLGAPSRPIPGPGIRVCGAGRRHGSAVILTLVVIRVASLLWKQYVLVIAKR